MLLYHLLLELLHKGHTKEDFIFSSQFGFFFFLNLKLLFVIK